MDEEGVLSIVRGRKGCYDYSEISGFKQHLKEAGFEEENIGLGWVMWRENERYEQELDHRMNNTAIQHKIITLLKYIACNPCNELRYLIQFWSVVKVEGQQHHCLSTSHQPFSVRGLNNGLSWFIKKCMDHVYEDGAEEEKRGGVGRVYRSKYPESTPDLRLYSANEFSLRDHAAHSGLRNYLVLPIFDYQTKECYGVLELLSDSTPINILLLYSLDQGLQIAGLRSTHINFIPISPRFDLPDKYYNNEQPETEITKLLKLAIKASPRLCLAQVWVPCKQCANMSTHLRCMERSSFIHARYETVNTFDITENDMIDYLQACEFHNLQIDLNCIHPNLCDVRISKYTLVHYANRARLSLHFSICLESIHNSTDFYVIEFFVQSVSRGDAFEDSSMNLLLKMMEMELKSFNCVSRGQLSQELIGQKRHPIPNECELIDSLKVMDSYDKIISEANFTQYLEIVDLCCLQPYLYMGTAGRRVFFRSAGEEGYGNDVNRNSTVKKKIEHFMKEITLEFRTNFHCIVQFWAPKMVKDRCYLETSYQPFAVGCPAKGLASFRKKYMQHHYFVDKEAKEEELGPPGRVFRSGHPEITPDLFLYSTKEFPMRNHALHCCLRAYFALPVFDKQKNKCAGVLEFIGFSFIEWKSIERTLRAAKLRSVHFHSSPRSYMTHSNRATFIQVETTFLLIAQIPQLHMANFWIPYGKNDSLNSHPRRMELAYCTKGIKDEWDCMPTHQVRFINIQHKKGIIPMVLKSESKSCFCRNLSDFSIGDQPLAHYERRERRNICFAICLQCSYTEDLVYVVEFFLNDGPASYEYLRSFLNFLLPIMKQELRTFKIASGKQLGEELVVEVIEFSEANKLTSSESDQQPNVFPIKFKSVNYYQKEHQRIHEEQVSVSYATQTEKCHDDDSDLKKTETGKGKIGLHLSLEVLKPHFGKILEDVAQDLGVGRSTIKRACRRYGIDRWPGNEKQARNPSLFERKRAENVLHTNVESTQHQKLKSQDKPKDKKGNFPAKLHLFKRDDDDDDIVQIIDDDIVQTIDDNNTLLEKDVALTTGSKNAGLPGPLKMLCSYAKHDLNDGRGILIALDNDVFGNKCKVYVHPEDIIPFCDLEPISGNCVVVYIWHLYTKMKRGNTIRRFHFVNPFTISYVPNMEPITRAHALATRLITASSNQLVLVPCNIGEHWILTIIEPYKEVVSLLDPLNQCICDKSWEHAVNIAMSMFNANLKKSIIEQPTWKIIKVPHQPDFKQCGYYVMCYMKEIVQGLNTIDSSSLSSLFVREEYSQNDINEVRIEWAHCVQEHA